MTQIPDGKIKKTYFVKFKETLKKFGITVAEWHSLGIGVGTAVIGGPALAAAVYTGATTVKGVKGHMKDLKKEIGYFVGSFCVVEYGFQALQVVL
ncbi:MAG: hypothetical protein ABEK04_03385 [Candidatus Nanohalobium sp.]